MVRISVCLYLIAFVVPVFGQLKTAPIHHFENNPGAAIIGRSARTAAVNLPFFDDFSLSKNGKVGADLWLTSGGTLVNNTLPLNHPTVNVVTFDGLNRSGVPYSFTNENSEGPGDTLTSQPINLAGFAPKDSLYLSFYWQARGLGELPDTNDSLQLQFKNKRNVWRTVWVRKGGLVDNNFKQDLIALRDTALFGGNFQFRFQQFGRESGFFDVWHVDYVYLNANRTFRDRPTKDLAVRQPVSSFLKRYSAMPLAQYLANPRAETSDTLTTELNSLFNQTRRPTFFFTAKDERTNQIFQASLESGFIQVFSFSSFLTKIKVQPLPDEVKSLKKLTLVSTFAFNTTDEQDPPIRGIDLTRNDTISGRTVFDDYFAYDDGSAELAAFNVKPLSRTAVQFILNKPDSLAGMRLNIVPIRKNLINQPMTLQVWNNERGKPKNLLYQKSYRVSYPADPRSGFVDFKFDFGVAVKDTFYVGWLQIGNDPLPVGLDKNTRSEDKIFTNEGQEWISQAARRNDPNYLSVSGSLLIRPVLGSAPRPPVLANSPEILSQLLVFPNPTTGVVRWQNESIQQIELLNLGGQILQHHLVNALQNELNLGQLPTGLYLLRLSDGKRSQVQKLLIQH